MIDSVVVGSRLANSSTAPTTFTGFRSVVTIAGSCTGVAVALWLIPASVEIVGWTSAGTVRAALFAPLFRLWLALAAACGASVVLVFAPSRSREALPARARTVAPLVLLWLWTVPYWPWLPDRAPALMIFAGAVRWLVVAMAITGVVLAWRKVRPWRRLGLVPLPGRRTVLVLTLLAYVLLGMRSLATVGLGGDEPHYLIITQSLLVDRDLQIENNHARGDYRPFFGGDLRPDYMRRGQNGEIYSIHSPGLPLLLLPGYAVLGARGAVITMCVLAALAALAVFDIALAIGGPIAAILTWVSVCLTVPFVPHAWLLYPETAAAAIIAWTLLWLLKPLPARLWIWTARGASLATLPWLHTKFLVLLLPLLMFVLWRVRARVKDAVAFLLPVVLSLTAWIAFFYVIYGSIDPQVSYGNYPDQFVRFANIPRSLLGLLLDQKFGLVFYSPAYVLVAAGMWLMLRDAVWRGTGVVLVITALAYIISSARLYMWWGGSSAPARFLVPILPLLAPPMAAAFAWMPGRVTRATAALCIAWGLTVASIGTAVPDRLFLFSSPHGVARLLESVRGGAPIAAALPTFTEENWTTPLGRAVPWAVAAAAALCVAGVVAVRARPLATFWIGVTEVVTFATVGSLLASPTGASARADAAAQGRMELMDEYDPGRLRGFDYRRMIKLDPDGLLKMSALTFDRAGDEPVDEAGHVAGPVELPPGQYEARVWFNRSHPYVGNLLLTDRHGNILARADGPLPNPATITFEWPVPIVTWVGLSDQTSARAVRRVELAPHSVVPKSLRVDVRPRAVEPIEDRPHAYIVYGDDNTHPEGGVFWTRGAERGEVLVAPADARVLVLTLHVGPNAGKVRVNVGGQDRDVEMQPNDTREVLFQLPGNARVLPVSVQAPQWFRPADVDPGSTDTRALGCQVRISLR